LQNKLKNHIYMFQKKYGHCQINILQACKITIHNCFYNRLHENDNIWRFKNMYNSLYSDPHFCHFCVAQTINYFHFIFYTFVGYISGYIRIFSLDFCGIKKYNFQFFKSQDHWSLGARNIHSKKFCLNLLIKKERRRGVPPLPIFLVLTSNI
jgi:hypothetical protein